MFRLRILLLCALLTFGVAAHSHADGTLFWGYHLHNFNSASMGIQVVNPGSNAATVSILGATGVEDSRVVTPGGWDVFEYQDVFKVWNTDVRTSAFLVRSDAPVSAYVRNPYRAGASDDMSTLLPVEALGTRHIAFSWASFEGDPDNYLDDLPGLVGVVGVTQEPTEVTIVAPVAIRAGGPIPATPAGTPITRTLQQFEVLQIATEAMGTDFTGTVVTSDRPVAVFSGTVCTFLPAGRVCCCDHLEDQLFPASYWGTEVLALKSAKRGSEVDHWRIAALENATTVTIDPDPSRGPMTLQAGEWFEFTSDRDHHVAATGPIQVMQYLASAWTHSGKQVDTGDPLMMAALPTGLYLQDHLFVTPQRSGSDFYDTNYLSIVAPAGTHVDWNGAAVSPALFESIGNSSWMRAQFPVDRGIHHITSDTPSAAYLHGYADWGSYGYHVAPELSTKTSSIDCSAVATVSDPCAPGEILLDASGSSGPGPLRFLWSSFTGPLRYDDPGAATTAATYTGSFPLIAAVTVSNGVDEVTCSVEVADAASTVDPPTLDCPARIARPADSLVGAIVAVQATVESACRAQPTVVNDRTSGGLDATDAYPCGVTPVTFTVTDALGQEAECVSLVDVVGDSMPLELSGAPYRIPLGVSKIRASTSELQLTFEESASGEAVNIYRGTIPFGGWSGYNHGSLGCHEIPPIIQPGVMAREVRSLIGAINYFLVSRSTCLAEGSRGADSSGVPRPDFSSDCGAP